MKPDWPVMSRNNSWAEKDSDKTTKRLIFVVVVSSITYKSLWTYVSCYFRFLTYFRIGPNLFSLSSQCKPKLAALLNYYNCDGLFCRWICLTQSLIPLIIVFYQSSHTLCTKQYVAVLTPARSNPGADWL